MFCRLIPIAFFQCLYISNMNSFYPKSSFLTNNTCLSQVLPWLKFQLHGLKQVGGCKTPGRTNITKNLGRFRKLKSPAKLPNFRKRVRKTWDAILRTPSRQPKGEDASPRLPSAPLGAKPRWKWSRGVEGLGPRMRPFRALLLFTEPPSRAVAAYLYTGCPRYCVPLPSLVELCPTVLRPLF